MTTTTRTLDAEGLKRIYTDPKFRNAVVGARTCRDRNMQFLGYKTAEYPVDHIVTAEQIEEAKAEQQRARDERIANMGNKLVFVGMGMDYEPKFKDDVGNFRIRTNILRADGVRFFVEFVKDKDNRLMCDHSILRIPTPPWASSRDKNNYGDLESHRHRTLPEYTLKNVLHAVNTTFGTHFTEVEVDSMNLHCDDYESKDPGQYPIKN